MLIRRDRCWSFREKSAPFSSLSPRALCAAAQCPPSFSGTCHAFAHLRAFPRGFIFLGSPHSHAWPNQVPLLLQSTAQFAFQGSFPDS